MSLTPAPSQHERQSRLLDAMPAIAWSASAATFRFTYVNPGAESVLGYPAERWLEEPHFWIEHLHPDDRAIAAICHNETLSARDHELVYRMIAADGRVVWLRDYVKVHSVDGEPVELFGIMVDITREREAEAASMEDRENFRRMVELSPDCIGVHVDGTYVYVNQAFVQLLGAKNEAEILGRSPFSFADPSDHEVMRERLARLSEGQSVPYLRQTYHRIDGSPLAVEVAALPLRYGNRDAVQVIARDITDRVRAELELREAEQMRIAAEAKFRWLVEHSVVAVYMLAGTRLMYINDMGAKMLGYTADELVWKDLSTLVVEDDQRAATFYEDGATVTRVRRKDGTFLHVVFYQNEVTLNGQKIVIGTAADVTERLRAQQALEASEVRYRALVEDVTDILFTLDREGRFVSLNRSFERSTGYRVDEWIGRPFAELFTPCSDLQSGDAAIREYHLPAKSGARVTVEVSSQPRYLDGVVTGTIGMARDVTEHRNIARKLEDAKRMSSLGQVAASLAHEFNNVLMGIQPFVQLIARHAPPTETINEALGHVTRAIGRGKRASQEILRFANPQKPQLSVIDVRSWLPMLIGQLQAAVPVSITLSSSMEAGVRFIRGDREHLEQVITNLVFNARDAIAGGGGRIDVDVRGGAEFVHFSVTDNGPGIPLALMDRIFEPLFTTKRNGTGLGLAIARRLIEGQGGTLAAENRPEGGAAFHVLVPVAEAPPIETASRALATPGIRRILLVEDDLSVGTGLESLLRSEGYETTWVRASSDAPEAARRTQPQVAIIDVNLPDGNGIDLIPLLRAKHCDLPVVLSTGHVELNVSQQDKHLVSLMKPYELDDLLDAIASVTAAA